MSRTGYFGALVEPTGRFNTRLMFERDPGLRAICDEFVSAQSKSRNPTETDNAH